MRGASAKEGGSGERRDTSNSSSSNSRSSNSGSSNSSSSSEGTGAGPLRREEGGMLVQNALKYLLRFGEVSPLLSFDTLQNFFYSIVLQPSPFCADPWCQLQQVLLLSPPADLTVYERLWIETRTSVYEYSVATTHGHEHRCHNGIRDCGCSCKSTLAGGIRQGIRFGLLHPPKAA
ncbi:UNVERIFIED_CONTAM: hypothetical protein H355_004496 [Colinus virginianus]|nr:hypothetical protein H355_004496 [Colinus virginianus]